MGISLDIYRQRIGCFSRAGLKIKRKSKLQECRVPFGAKNANIFGSPVKIILLLALFYQVQAAAPIFLQQSSSFHTSLTSLAALGSNLHNNYPTNVIVREIKAGLHVGQNHQYLASSFESLDVNFFARYVNGNKRRDGIKIMHQNLGSGYLINKMNNVETIVAGYKPHVLGISETSFMDTHDINYAKIDGYNAYLSFSVFVHKDIIVKERAINFPQFGWSLVYQTSGSSLFVTCIVIGSIWHRIILNQPP